MLIDKQQTSKKTEIFIDRETNIETERDRCNDLQRDIDRQTHRHGRKRK